MGTPGSPYDENDDRMMSKSPPSTKCSSEEKKEEEVAEQVAKEPNTRGEREQIYLRDSPCTNSRSASRASRPPLSAAGKETLSDEDEDQSSTSVDQPGEHEAQDGNNNNLNEENWSKDAGKGRNSNDDTKGQMVDSSRAQEAKKGDKEFEFLYDTLRQGRNVLMIGSSLKSFNLFVEAIEMGFKAKFVFGEDKLGKFEELIGPDRIPVWLRCPPRRRGPFEVSAEVHVCLSSDLTLIEGKAMTNGCYEECLIRANRKWNGDRGEKPQLTYRKEDGGKDRKDGGWSILKLDSDAWEERDEGKAGKEESHDHHHDWFQGMRRLSVDCRREVDKYRPVCLMPYSTIFLCPIIHAVLADIPSFLAVFYYIPLAYFLRGVGDMLEWFSLFQVHWRNYNPRDENTKGESTRELKVNVALVAFSQILMFVIAPTARFNIDSNCDDMGENCTTGSYYFSYFFMVLFITSIQSIAAIQYAVWRHGGFPGGLKLGRVMWTYVFFSQLVLWASFPSIMALSNWLDYTVSMFLGALSISVGFICVQFLAVMAYGAVYQKLVYGGLVEVEGMKNNKDEPRLYVPGDQKRNLVYYMCIFYSWCEIARTVCLLCKTIWYPNDFHFVASLAITSSFNIFSRSGYTTVALVKLLPTHALKSCVLPTLATNLYDDAKCASGWHRFGPIVGMILGKVIWFHALGNKGYEGGGEGVAYWNDTAGILLLLSIAFTLVEDACVYLLSVCVKPSSFWSPQRLLYHVSRSTYQWVNHKDPYNPYVLFQEPSSNTPSTTITTTTPPKKGSSTTTKSDGDDDVPYGPIYRGVLMNTYGWRDLWFVATSGSLIFLTLGIFGVGKDAFIGIGPPIERWQTRILSLIFWQDHTVL